MKKTICLALLLVFVMLAPSCKADFSGANSSNKYFSGYEKEFPSPKNPNWEESGNVTGARFNMTLREYTEKFNEMYNSLGGGSEELEFTNWQLQKSGQYDDNGVEYDYYYYADDKAVLTATVETVSGKLMNLGCGTTLSVFVNDSDPKYQGIILNMTGIMAAVAGGYSAEDVKFFSDMYVDTISNSNSSFWYNNCIYLLNIQDNNNDRDSTMLFRVVAAKDSIESDWKLIDYKTYLQNETKSSDADSGGNMNTMPTGVQGAENNK